ncbi:uncharacterized protein SPAPADRAFT_133304 [Spathaspora passalidarum NRRL Y-27907]|uniref:Histone-lysine N-methyltransferase, H3 lysine-4 specific n=1 Tax=Spathaspora passalidarum (strain NRRL Y-27907 / 11-Y1) TaxID=619300 RepID=G3AEH0_SPAPN|nr:uncharacterized protein SPAPADRAFT_133304 [Spathaspora passalidarum NRRL Y-27907]EGW34732.1 hypothetical protein SPAPADRAFT_133304 [Spathaspora passalidarum NRRL Y-27907]
MSYNRGYSHRGYSGSSGTGSYRDNRYRSGRTDSSFRRQEDHPGATLTLNKSSHYDDSNNNNNRPHHLGSRFSAGSRNGGSSTPNGSNSDRNGKSSGTPTKGSQTPVRRIEGSDLITGENPKDSDFNKLLHHKDYTDTIPFSRPVDSKKNYKVIYDPEFDKSLSKDEKKTKTKKLRFHGEGMDDKELVDPRLSHLQSYFQKPNKKSKKFPFKQLPQPRFVFDKDSLGSAPRTQLVVWDLPATTSEIYLSNYFRSYGDPIEDMKFINDPENAVPLGIATFKFQGNPEKATRLAQKLVQSIKSEMPKIDGVLLKIGLNDNEDELLNKKIELARDKLKAIKLKREEEERRRQKVIEEQKRREEELKKKELEEQKKKKEQEAAAAAQEKQKVQESDMKYKPNTTILSIRRQNKVVSGVFLPKDLNKYVKDRAFILIHDKYVPTKKISSQDIKRVLNKYDWTRVLSDRTGFYVVFNSLNECERCFMNEDGRKFFEYRLYMEMAIPEGFSSSPSEEEEIPTSKKNDVIEEATNILIKELETFLAKDIRERIIAPHILDLLGHEHYPKLVEELKAQEAASKPKVINTNDQLKQNALSILEKKRQLQQQQLLPSFRKLQQQNELKRRNARKTLVPMQHALNFDSDDEDEDEEETSRSATPAIQSLKRERSSTVTSADEFIEPEHKKPKKDNLKRSMLYESSSDEEMDEEMKEEEDKEVVDEEGKAEVKIEEEAKPEDTEIDYSKIAAHFQPTEDSPTTVYPESPLSSIFDLEALQSTLKDVEDLELAQQVLAEEGISPSHLKNIAYWAWKQKDIKLSSDEIAEEVENIEVLPTHLESESGAFRSDGYKKINDADKIHYLPHRRKVHKPLKTIQYEDDDEERPNDAASAVQSSRVNRANNRRFAADITAQIGNESDILSLNALTKRKKPVTFARSAIHNWGLYAMEPIAAKEMIIEYVGERIRQQVAQHREESYLKTGIGSSYLFRIDENTVIDATKKGGIARFINHCCSPSCTAKIIKVEGKKRIVIYALRDIEANEELTYDYKFERETNDEERIRCLCGAPGCKGYLN